MTGNKAGQANEANEAAADAFLRPADVGRILGVTQNTLSQWRFVGRGPSYLKMSGAGQRSRVRYRKNDVEKWIEKTYTVVVTSGQGVA